MRSLHLVPFLGAAGLAAALLVACGGNSALVPSTVASVASTPRGTATAGAGTLLGAAPTPYVAPSASAFPSPSVSATSISGLPSPSSAGVATP